MNFSAIPSESLLGRLVRLPLKLLPSKLVLPVMQGPMKGMRWIVGSGDHGYWLGSYELDIQRLLSQTIKPGHVVLDIGAHVGFYTLLASRLVGQTGWVHSVEPLPRNIEYIQRHVEINRLSNVSIHQVAISDRSGEASFGGGSSSSTGHIFQGDGLPVQTITLDELAEGAIQSEIDVLKVDVEGAEHSLLKGGSRTLESHAPVVFLATHGAEQRELCARLLTSLNYSLVPINAATFEDASEFMARAGNSI